MPKQSEQKGGGEMTKTQFLNNTVENSFGCWIWQKATKKCKRGTHNYGWLTFKGKQTTAHRASYQLFVGEIPKGKCVCHKCDNPICVNPDHLFVGSQKDNVNDMIQKNRKWIGVSIRKKDGKPARAKLSDTDIAKIRLLRLAGLTQKEIGARFGVSQGCISQLFSGITQYAK
jgi:hypothetical protein